MRFPLLAFCVVMVALLFARQRPTPDGDAEVDLNTALGRRATPTTVVGGPIPTTPPESSSPPGATVSTVERPIPSAPATSTLVTTTTAVPCSSFHEGRVAVVVGEGAWWVEGLSDAGEPLRSSDLPTSPSVGDGDDDDVPAPAGPPRVAARRDLDGDGRDEVFVTAPGIEAPELVRVFTLLGCDLVEPVMAVTGNRLSVPLGIGGSVAGGVVCDGAEVIATVLGWDGSAPAPTEFLGDAVLYSLFGAVWERLGSSPVVVATGDLAASTQLDC